MFGDDEGCEADTATVVGLIGALCVILIVIGLYVFKLHEDSKHESLIGEAQKAHDQSDNPLPDGRTTGVAT
jgi:hypothetical protein